MFTKAKVTRNVGQCTAWWPPCRIQVAPSVPRHKVWLAPIVPCSNAAKTWNPLKFAGVPQSSPYYEDISLLNKFFPIVDMCLSCEDIAWQSCAMVPRWQLFGDFLRPAFPASRAQHVSDLHYKFTLGPHHVTKYGRHPLWLGEEKKERR